MVLLLLNMFMMSNAVSIDDLENTTYKVGSQGNEVVVLKQALKIAGSYKEVEVSDFFGTKTTEAVEHFQLIHTLKVDGVIGKKTISILSEYDYWPIIEAKNYEKGIKENSVRYIQAALHSEGCLKTLEFTDEYDDITFDAVKNVSGKISFSGRWYRRKTNHF